MYPSNDTPTVAKATVKLKSMITTVEEQRKKATLRSNPHNNMNSVIKFKRLSNEAIIPKKQTYGSVGMDLATTGEYEKGPNCVFYYKTGLAVEPPEGYYFEIHPRSSLHKKGWMMVNSIGIIDSDYRGELIVPLIPINIKNIDNSVYSNIEKIDDGYVDTICRFGDIINSKTRIAQLILRKNELIGINVEETNNLTNTERGTGGFGSTDIALTSPL